jgi:hypothetical protein
VHVGAERCAEQSTERSAERSAERSVQPFPTTAVTAATRASMPCAAVDTAYTDTADIGTATLS